MSGQDRRTRVMVVDDAVVARLLVTEALHADPELELAGTAVNGRVALEKLDELRPDVVVLDVEMPELDGLATLKAIRARDRRLPVVMFSTLTSRGQATTLEALTLGASDYVCKPSTGSREESVRVLREELLPLLKALGGHRRLSTAAATAVPSPRAPLHAARVELVVLGSSTGGPNALAEVLPQLPADLGVPVLVVQHMPAEFTSLLATRLDGVCPLPVAEAQHGELLQPGTVRIARGGQHLRVERAGTTCRLVLDDGPAVHSCRPSVDVLLASAAASHGRGVLAAVLTGMGRDGLDGSRAVRAAGGQVVVQDEQSSVVWGMGRHVAEAGLADAVVPLSSLGTELLRRTGGPPVRVRV